MNLEQKKDLATDQLFSILKEIGPVDYDFLHEELYQLWLLEHPTDEYMKGILEGFSGSWEQFVEIWRAFHMYRIAKRMWRKFERIAKKYPNFDKIIFEIADESQSGKT